MFGGRQFLENVVGCENCGFRFLEPVIGGEHYYREADHNEYQALRDARRRYFLDVREAIERFRSRLLPDSRILDLGAGEGDWLAAWPEITKRFATEVQPEFVRSLQRQNITALSVPEDSPAPFDMISAFDFLEHVENPHSLLQRIHAKLSPGGTVVFGVPDMGKWVARLLGTRYYLYCPMHYSYFNRSSLELLLAQYFVEVKVLVSPPMRATLNAAAKWIWPGLQSSSVGNLWLPFGYRASLIAVARKHL